MKFNKITTISTLNCVVASSHAAAPAPVRARAMRGGVDAFGTTHAGSLSWTDHPPIT